ncbi:hypothetical protein [Nocardia africana]
MVAAQSGAMTRAMIANVFGHDDRADIDGALFQLPVAGLTAEQTGALTASEAVALVRGHILRQGYDTTGFPLSSLRAEPLGVGWTVSSPVPVGEIALDRAVFYVADDGVVERSSSSVPRSQVAAGFERRFRLRQADRVSPEEST